MRRGKLYLPLSVKENQDFTRDYMLADDEFYCDLHPEVKNPMRLWAVFHYEEEEEPLGAWDWERGEEVFTVEEIDLEQILCDKDVPAEIRRAPKRSFQIGDAKVVGVLKTVPATFFKQLIKKALLKQLVKKFTK